MLYFGMKTHSGFGDIGYRNVFGKIAVQIIADLFDGFVGFEETVCGHGFRMNPCIGAACAKDFHFRASHFGEDGFDFALDGQVDSGLVFPAVETASVV